MAILFLLEEEFQGGASEQDGEPRLALTSPEERALARRELAGLIRTHFALGGRCFLVCAADSCCAPLVTGSDFKD
jgi:hypothetical protein